MVPPNHAIPHQALQENRSLPAATSGAHLELLPRSEADFQRRRGGSEQQGQTHHEKILRFSHLSRSRTRPLPLTWQASRAGIDPRFLLKSLKNRPDELFSYTPGNLIAFPVFIQPFWRFHQPLPNPLVGIANQLGELGECADLRNL